MAKFFVTYAKGSNQSGCYSIVEAESYYAAREKIGEQIGRRFAFCYDEDAFNGQIETYGLREIPLTAQVNYWEMQGD